MKQETLPLNLKVESEKFADINAAITFLDKFLHDNAAIHSANNTVAAQLHQLYQGLKEEKKRLKSAAENSN